MIKNHFVVAYNHEKTEQKLHYEKKVFFNV